MTRNRLAVLVVAALALLAFLGRREESSWRSKENRGIASIRRAVGDELRHPKAYRENLTFACLIYPSRTYAYGLELCFAPTGAIVEAIHRGPGINPTIWSLRADPGAARVHENPAVVAHLLDGLGAQTGTTIQVGARDLGGRIPTYTTTP